MTQVTLYGHVLYYGSNPQMACFNHAARKGHKIFFKVINALGHCFGSTENRETLVEIINKDHTVQELLKSKVNFFADIDSKEPIDVVGFTEEFKKRLELYEPYDAARMRWSDCTRSLPPCRAASMTR